MATLCEVTVFSVSLNSWKASGFRIFRDSVADMSVENYSTWFDMDEFHTTAKNFISSD